MAAANRRAFPPLFVWTVAQSGEDLASGFQRAAELYQARALYRSEMLLYSALPCSILALAAMIVHTDSACVWHSDIIYHVDWR